MNFFDGAVYNLIFKLHSIPNTVIMKIISFSGSIEALFLITLGILLLRKGKGKSKFIIFNLICSFALSQILKIIFRRQRPEVFALTTQSGYSFPSEHAIISTVFYGFLIYLVSKKIKDKKKKKIYIGILLGWIFLIGISRIYLGINYATDVLVGNIVGIVYLLIILKYIFKKK